MAEIRIPYDRIPEDILRRLQDISNGVLNPCAINSPDAGGSPVLALPSPAGQDRLAATSAITTQPFSFIPTSSSSSPSSSLSLSSYSSSRASQNPGIGVSKNRTSCAPSVFVSRLDEADAGQDEVDGADADSIVHVVNDAELRHQRSTRASGLGVMDDSDIVRIFPDAEVGKPTLISTSSGSEQTQNSFHSDEDSGIVRIFPENDDDDETDDKDDVDHGTPFISHVEIASSTRPTYKTSPLKISSPSRQSSTAETTLTSIHYPLTFNPLHTNDLTTGHSLLSGTKTHDRVQRSSHENYRFSPYKNGKQQTRLGPYSVNNKKTHNNISLPHEQGIYDRLTSSPCDKKQSYDDIIPQPILSLSPCNVTKMKQNKISYYDNENNNNNNNNNNHVSANNNRNTSKQIITSESKSGSVIAVNDKSSLLPSTPAKFVKLLETTPTKVIRKSPSTVGTFRRSPGLPTPPQTPDEAETEDDNEVFVYSAVNRPFNAGEAVKPFHDSALQSNSAHLRHHSDSRTNETWSPFSPTHKMSRMRVGDRQHTRKRLSFDEVEPGMKDTAHESANQFWQGDNFHVNSNSNFMQRSDIAAAVQNRNVTRRKSSSPLNSPPRSHQPNNPCLPSFEDSEHMSVVTYDRQVIRPTTSVQVCCSSSSHCQSSPRFSHYQPSDHAHCQSSLPIDQSNPYLNPSRRDVTMEEEEENFPNSHTPMYSPSARDVTNRKINQMQYTSRHRFYSEGYSDDEQESPDDRTRFKNSNNDISFLGRPRVQTFSSYGKRRRMDVEDHEGEEIDLTPVSTSLQTPPPLPARYTQPPPSSPPPSPLLSNTTTTNNSPPKHHTTNTPAVPVHHTLTSPHQPKTPQEDCQLCATALRNFLGMVSHAYNCLRHHNAATEDFTVFRREMAQTNNTLRESMNIINNARAMCNHHVSLSTRQASAILEPCSSSIPGATTTATATATSSTIPDVITPPTEPGSAQPPFFFPSFNSQMDYHHHHH